MEKYNDMRESMFKYKNFAMVHELDIAGEFLYSAIEKINKMESFYNISEDFYFLYHVAVGIERMQKVLLVILYDVSNENMENFMKSIKHHNHKDLHDKIRKKRQINLSNEQYNLIDLLTKFYQRGRYERFNYNSNIEFDKNILTDFILDNCKNIGWDKISWSFNLVNNEETKEFFGRIIGRLGQKYYEVIEEEARKRNLYSYELRYDSPAEKLFLHPNDKGSYQKKIQEEKRAIKELLLYLNSPLGLNKFIEYMQEIEPLPFEIALIQEYFTDLCNKVISQELLNEVDFMYNQRDIVGNKKKRERALELLGDKGVIFD